MNKKIFGLAALAVAIVCSFAFNKPATIKDVTCGDVPGKFWFVYTNTATPVEEDSDDATQEAAAKLASNYVRLQSLDDCDAEQLLCAICAFPQAGTPSRPQITGQTIATDLTNYINSQASHASGVIVEKAE